MPIPRSPFPDYYADLRIAPDASQDEVRSAWRQAAKRWHPDTNGSADAPAMMRRVNDAWDVLGDPNNRREYDDMYYVWRSSSEQLAVGLRERLNETRQRTRDEAAAWSRWAEQDRTTWERQAKQEASRGAAGQRDNVRGTTGRDGERVAHQPSAPATERNPEQLRRLRAVMGILSLIIVAIAVMAAIANSN